MLFDKDVRKVCAFCLHGQDFSEDTVLCKKRGPVPFDHCCRKFVYDPLRRTPTPAAKLRGNFNEDSFKLD